MLFREDANTPLLDMRDCYFCHLPIVKLPPHKSINKKTNSVIYTPDRSNRIDCDAAGNGEESFLVTYHRSPCYTLACDQYLLKKMI